MDHSYPYIASLTREPFLFYADQMISIDLDDGVKKNYAIFQDVLVKIKERRAFS